MLGALPCCWYRMRCLRSLPFLLPAVVSCHPEPTRTPQSACDGELSYSTERDRCECPQTPEPTLAYHGRCLSRAALEAAYECPAATTVQRESMTMETSLWCEHEGARVGVETSWVTAEDSSGLPRQQITWDGERGEVVQFHLDSELVWQRFELLEGVPHGEHRIWDENGTLREEGRKFQGELHGRWSAWDERGELIAERCAERGRLLWKEEPPARPGARPCEPRDDASDATEVVTVWDRREPAPAAFVRQGGSTSIVRFTLDHTTEVQRLAKPGGEPELVWERAQQGIDAAAGDAWLWIAFDEELVVLEADGAPAWVRPWSTDPTVMAAHGERLVVATPLDGGWALVEHDAADARVVVRSKAAPIAIAVDDAGIAWLDLEGSVAVLDAGASTPRVVARDRLEPSAIALDGPHVYWTENGELNTHEWFPGEGAVTRASRAGDGAPQTLVVVGAPGISLVVGPEHAFWGNPADGWVMRLPKDGGTPQVVYAKANHPDRLALVSGELCWLDRVLATVSCADPSRRDRISFEPL